MEVSNPEGLGDAARGMGRLEKYWRQCCSVEYDSERLYGVFNGIVWVIVAILRQAV
jgi:hypothetical protein